MNIERDEPPPTQGVHHAATGPHNITEHYRGERALLPELAAFGWDRHTVTHRALAAHVHERAYEICYLAGGSVQWWVGPELYTVERGGLFLTRPGERHGGLDAMMHPCELFFVELVLDRTCPLPGLTATEHETLVHGYETLPRRCFPAEPMVATAMHELRHEHRSGDPCSATAARAALHRVLVGVLRSSWAAQADREGRPARTAEITDALHWMQRHLAEDWRVRELADAVGLGVSRLHERFVAEVGFPPADYRNRMRVAEAKRRLTDTDEAVTAIAFELGFTTSQYFATVFRKLVGIPPGAYRRRSRAAA